MDQAVLKGFFDLGTKVDDLRADVLTGLAQDQKRLPAKYFYDSQGSQLFDRICALPEYYPTRTEVALLHQIAPDLADMVGPGLTLIEFGSGSNLKVRALLDQVPDIAAYVPIDISRDHLVASAEDVAKAYPDLAVVPICADFTREIALPEGANGRPRLGLFPGSTIGNFEPDEAKSFLQRARASLEADSGFLIGVDLKKDERILNAAYNDAEGVTAAFNLNLLRRLNRELGATFDLDKFAHRAFYNADAGRVEMHLVSLFHQTVTVSGVPVNFAACETIHTENSHKYTVEGFQDLARDAGWTPLTVWTDAEDLFSIHYLHHAG